MSGRHELRATAEQITRDHADLLSRSRSAEPVAVRREALEAAQDRLTGRREGRGLGQGFQLPLDLGGPYGG